MAKCLKCGFEGHIKEWIMVEESGVTKVPEKAIKQYEEFADTQAEGPVWMKALAKAMFRGLGEAGLMPYHAVQKFVCPKCGTPLQKEESI